MKGQEIICIQCPKGCRGSVGADQTGKIILFEGYDCTQGKKYAETEAREPSRVLTATIRIDSRNRSLLPVKADKAIPRNRLKDCMKVLAKVRVAVPVRIGQVIIPDILDTGANVVATMNIGV
jgi:CxxC motif-containing protein